MKVFVSYSRADSSYARKLVESLQQQGIDVSADLSIPAGASWATELRRMIDDADAFVLLVSKASTASEWANRELAAAVARSTHDRNVRLIPVMLDRHANPPPLLSRYQFIGPPVTKDPDQVADRIQESLSASVSPSDPNLEREILNTERASLSIEIESRHSALTKSWSALARVLSVAALIAGITSTTLVAVWMNTSPQAVNITIAVVSVMSSALAGAVAFYFRRSRNDK